MNERRSENSGTSLVPLVLDFLPVQNARICGPSTARLPMEFNSDSRPPYCRVTRTISRASANAIYARGGAPAITVVIGKAMPKRRRRNACTPRAEIGGTADASQLIEV